MAKCNVCGVRNPEERMVCYACGQWLINLAPAHSPRPSADDERRSVDDSDSRKPDGVTRLALQPL